MNRPPVNQVFTFGHGFSGELGHGTEENEKVPRPIEDLTGKQIVTVSCGAQHTAALTSEGEVFTWGSNEHGQLGRAGRQMRPMRVEALDSMSIAGVACGDHHTAAWAQNGYVLSWGLNDSGQLGHGTRESSARPRYVDWSQTYASVVKEPRARGIVAVSLGAKHSLFLSELGDVFACGKNSMGQLGQHDTEDRRWPVPIRGLSGRPVVAIVAGGQHSMALTVSGDVFSFGGNTFGQLGVGDNEHRTVPTAVDSLRGLHIVQLACGANHVIARSKKGPIYTWGQGMFNQLGHGRTENELSPRCVFELLGSHYYRVACGAKHTLVLRAPPPPSAAAGANEATPPADSAAMSIDDHGAAAAAAASVPSGSASDSGGGGVTQQYAPVLSWGTNSSGQLGLGDVTARAAPTAVDSLKGVPVCDIAAGGLHSAAIAVPDHPPAELDELHLARLRHTDLARLRRIIDHAYGDYTGLERLLETIWTTPAALNASFLLPDEHFDTSETRHGLDLPAVREAYNRLLGSGSQTVMTALTHSTSRLIDKLRHCPSDTPDSLRVFLILLENPVLGQTSKQNLPLMERFVGVYAGLQSRARDILRQWYRQLPSEYFIRIVHVFQRFLSFLVSMQISSQTASVCSILTFLYELNEKSKILPYTQFYNHEVSTLINFREEYERWKGAPTVFSFFRHAFLLEPVAKSAMLHLESEDQMIRSMSQVQQTMTFESPYLILPIRRDHMVEDALMHLASKPSASFKKPLKVVFHGEEGVDAGGVQKEFFSGVMRQLFQPAYGMFTYSETSRLFWFSPTPVESPTEFRLVGILLGLAIYNGVQVDVRFPMVLYKKLLGVRAKEFTLQDLMEVSPELGISLQKLLDYPGDVEEDLGAYFQITVESFGSVKTVDLVENGSETAVTNDNRHEYVSAYIRFMLDEAVAAPFAEFSQGFRLVASGRTLDLCRPEELEVLIRGNEFEPDFKALEAHTQYEGFSKDEPIIRGFWTILHNLPGPLKKRFLAFCTGSDRVPVGGIGQLRMIVQKQGGDTDRLPAASTCFNTLLLPQYSSAEVMKNKLIQAIQEGAEGFGFR